MKTIVYLDQNYVSYLTKARLGVKVYPVIAAYYKDLYDVLRGAVRANAVVCPVSHFHHSESALDPRLGRQIFRTLQELYCGVEFHGFVRVVQGQVAEALADFLGAPESPEPRWRQAFNEDPQQDCAKGDHIAPIGLFLEIARTTKAFHETQREVHPVGEFGDQKRFEADQLVSNLYLMPFLSLAAGNTDIFTVSGLDFIGHLLRLYERLLQRKPTSEEIAGFLKSPQMRAAPFIDVYSSLRAGMISWFQDRRPRGSDLEDLLIAATVLPYCGVFATDKYVKDLIRRLLIDRQYDVRVFGARKTDVLALMSVVRELIGA